MTALQRRVDFRPGYDKRDQKPNAGIDGGSLYWTVIGPLGAVSFEMLTNWYPDTVPQALVGSGPRYPLAAQITWHRPADRTAEGESAYSCDQCAFLGVPCSYSVCYTCSTPVQETLLTGGSDALWAKLEALYREEFEPKGPFTVYLLSAGQPPVVTSTPEYAEAEKLLLMASGSGRVQGIRVWNGERTLRSWNRSGVVA